LGDEVVAIELRRGTPEIEKLDGTLLLDSAWSLSVSSKSQEEKLSDRHDGRTGEACDIFSAIPTDLRLFKLLAALKARTPMR